MTDYYDGPTAGLFKCELCGRVYKFRMIDWDDRQEVRIHALTPMPTESFTRLEEITAKHGPKWWPEGAEVEDVLAQAASAATPIGLSFADQAYPAMNGCSVFINEEDYRTVIRRLLGNEYLVLS